MLIAWKHLPCARVCPHKDTEGETQTPQSLHSQHIKSAFGTVLCSAIQSMLDFTSSWKWKEHIFPFFNIIGERDKNRVFILQITF